MRQFINLDDYRDAARRRLPRRVFDYMEGGAEDERGLRHNRDALANLRFRPARLRNVASRDLSRALFGRRLPLPLAIAPTGLNGLLWPDGDVALARAAARQGLPFILSTASSVGIEELARRSDGEHWFQLYVVHRRLAAALVQRALGAGYTTLVLTVDVVRNGIRERDMRNRFGLPLRLRPDVLWDGLTHPRWSFDMCRHGLPRLANFAEVDKDDTEVQAALLGRSMDATFDWDALAWLRDLWPHRLLVKGILTRTDAEACVAHGADGVIVSNHGGRQLDDCISPIEALPGIRDALTAPVVIDSGFRRGADVIKAIALGADLVLLGRAALYGLAARGERGVDDVLALIRQQLDATLVQIGCPAIDRLSRDYLDVDPPPRRRTEDTLA